MGSKYEVIEIKGKDNGEKDGAN